MATAKMPQPQLFGHGLDPLFDLRGGNLTQLQRVSDVFKHVLWTQRIGLKHQTQVGAPRPEFRYAVAVIDAGFSTEYAAGRLLQPGDRPQQGGSAARWPEQRHHPLPASVPWTRPSVPGLSPGQMQVFYR